MGLRPRKPQPAVSPSTVLTTPATNASPTTRIINLDLQDTARPKFDEVATKAKKVTAVAEKTWHLRNQHLSTGMRTTPFGVDFEFTSVYDAEVASQTLGELGVQLNGDVCNACSLLNDVSARLNEFTLNHMADEARESTFESIALILHKLLCRAISDTRYSFRTIHLNKKSEDFTVPSLVLQFGNGVSVDGRGDLGTLVKVTEDSASVELMCVMTEMKSTITGTFLGQVSSEMVSMDGWQTPGKPFRLCDIARDGAHMCTGLLTNGQSGVNLTMLHGESPHTSSGGLDQHMFFLEVAGNLREGCDPKLAENKQPGVYHLLALQLLRTRERLELFEVAVVQGGAASETSSEYMGPQVLAFGSGGDVPPKKKGGGEGKGSETEPDQDSTEPDLRDSTRKQTRGQPLPPADCTRGTDGEASCAHVARSPPLKTTRSPDGISRARPRLAAWNTNVPENVVNRGWATPANSKALRVQAWGSAVLEANADSE
jgi:hypothetical protein